MPLSRRTARSDRRSAQPPEAALALREFFFSPAFSVSLGCAVERAGCYLYVVVCMFCLLSCPAFLMWEGWVTVALIPSALTRQSLYMAQPRANLAVTAQRPEKERRIQWYLLEDTICCSRDMLRLAIRGLQDSDKFNGERLGGTVFLG